MTQTMIKLADLMPHPMNAEIFTTSDKDNLELRSQIEMHGVVVPILANRRKDGKLRIISGHRRVDHSVILGHTEIKGEIISVGDAEELLLLFACNVGRDLKEAYKVRFFKQVKQFLRQYKNSIDNTATYETTNPETNPFVDIVHRLGVDAVKMKMWEVIEKITGFSEREQKTLTHVCDEEYRAGIMKSMDGIVPAKMKNQVKANWEALELAILNGETTVAKVDKEVVKLLKQIDEFKNPKTGEIKQVKKETPLLKDKVTTTNASVFVNTYENAYKYVQSVPLYQRAEFFTQAPEEIVKSFAMTMEVWAKHVLNNA